VSASSAHALQIIDLKVGGTLFPQKALNKPCKSVVS